MQEKNKPINKTSTVKAVDGLGNSVRDYIYNPAENKFEHKDDLVHESPLPVGMPREPKIHSAAYRRKYPERYGHKYTSKLDQAAYPKAGTAPSEKRVITDAEIQKKLDKLRGPSDWDMIYDGMSPQEKGSWNYEQRKKGFNGKTAEPINKVADYGPVKYDKNGFPNKATPAQMGAMAEKLEEMRQMTGEPDKPKPKKKINPYADVKIAIPTINHSLLRQPKHDARDAALKKLREYAFTPTPNPDAVRGIGSFKDTVGRKLKAATSRSDWEKNNQRTYE